MITTPVLYQTNWDNTNIHLKAPAETWRQTALDAAYFVLSIAIPLIGIARLIGYGIGKLANRVILPAASQISEEDRKIAKEAYESFWKGPLNFKNRETREVFSALDYTVATPDQAHLRVKYLRHKDSTSSTPTVIYFNRNMELALSELKPWMVEQSMQQNIPCNFVFFDYRGVGESTGNFKSTKDLIVDGTSIVQWVQTKLEVPPDKIHFYGQSLGGAIAAETQATNPTVLTGPHLNERSFSSLDQMIRSFGGCVAGMLAYILRDQGYSLNPGEACKKLKGPKLFVHHPHDQIIPTEASLQKEMNPNQVMTLKPKQGQAILGGRERAFTWEQISNQFAHNAPLDWHEGAVEKMRRFLLGSSPRKAAAPTRLGTIKSFFNWF